MNSIIYRVANKEIKTFFLDIDFPNLIHCFTHIILPSSASGGWRKSLLILSPVYILAVSDRYYEDRQHVIFYACYDAVVADSVSPELSKFRTFQSFPQAAGIVQLGYPVTKEIVYAFCNLPVKL